ADITRGAAPVPSLQTHLPSRPDRALIRSPSAGTGADHAHIESPYRDRRVVHAHSPCRGREPSGLGRLQGGRSGSQHRRLHAHHPRPRRNCERFRHRPPSAGALVQEQGRLRPRHRRLQRGDPARSQIRRGLLPTRRRLPEQGDLDRAIADYSEAIRLDPKLPVAARNRGNAYKDKGDFDRAIADSSEPIRLAPEVEAAHPETIIRRLAHYNRGGAYESKGDFDRAIADFSEVIRLNPKSP